MTMAISSGIVQEFMDLFTGSKHNYGLHEYDTPTPGKKASGKSFTVTDKLVTIGDYENHLHGRIGLGIIPISEASKCNFTVIDVDIYKDIDYAPYLNAIDNYGFPIVPFKSKSGGLHLYVFYKEEVAPTPAIDVAKKMAAILGLSLLVKARKNLPVEIFPKQTKLNATGEARYGNWINLPYYNAANNTLTPALCNGKELSLSDAIRFIRNKRTSIPEVKSFLDALPLDDAPPCLQTLNLLNQFYEESGRNNYLFSFGVYLKKKDPEEWEFKLKEINDALPKPIDQNELDKTVVASLKRKDYLYKCLDTPCVEFCDKQKCKTKEYGIGKEGGFFNAVEFGQLTQYNLSEPYYTWEVKVQGQAAFTELRFDTEDEIIKQDVFIKMCMRKLHELPVKLKQVEWFSRVNEALRTLVVKEIEFEDDTSPYVMLHSLVIEFLTGRAMAETKDQILAKRVYYDEEQKAYFFKTKDLNDFIYLQKQFRYFKPNQLHAMMKDMKFEARHIRTESRKQVRVMVAFKDNLQHVPQPELFQPDFSISEDY
jgi:hypothetical protein